MAFDRDAFNNVSSGGADALRIWSYQSSADTLATIEAADYFLDMRFALNQNDIIFLVGSDGSELVRVTSAVNATSVTVTAYDSVPAGTIVNADVSASAAIAFSKMEALATGEFVFGNAGTPTVGAMSGDATISAAGALTIANGAVELAMMASDSVDENKIVSTALGTNLSGGSGTTLDITADVPRTVTVAISNAEFLGMYATPKLLVAAGGANTLHIVHKVVYEVNYGTAQFANGGAVAVQYDSTANGAGTAASADVAAATFNGYSADSCVGADGQVASAASSTMVNKGLYLSNDTAAFITGDSTLNVHVTYSTVTTTV